MRVRVDYYFIEVSVVPNTTPSARSAYVLSKAQPLAITQAAGACSYALAPSEIAQVSDRGASGTLDLSSSCEWTVTAPSWVQITPMQGTGSATLRYTIQANSSTGTRSGTIQIATASVPVSQVGMNCLPDFTPTRAAIAAAGGNGSFSIATNPYCPWTVSTVQPWITIGSLRNGTGNGQVSFSVAPNPGPARTGSISTGSRAFTITQDSLNCSFVVTPTSADLPAGAGSDKVALTASAPACEWTAQSEAAWLKLSGPAAGTGSASLTYSYEANTTDAVRTGVLQVAGQRVTFAQAPGEFPVVTGVTDGASFASKVLSPGMLVVLFGKRLGTAALQSATPGPDDRLSTSLGGTRVLFDGTAAPLVYVSATQVAALVPFSTEGRTTAAVTVETAKGRSAAFAVRLAAAAPVFFTQADGRLAALNQDYSYNSPASPATAGQAVMLFATGGGVSTSLDQDGRVMKEAGGYPRQAVRLFIGGVPARVHYAGSAPGSPAGILQINAQVPAEAGAGPSVPVVLRIGDAESPAGATLSVGAPQR